VTFTLNPGQQRTFDETLTNGARFCLVYGGSRSGKTALLTSCVLDRALYAPGSRHLIVRKEGAAAKRAIAKDTLPKVWGLKYADAPLPEWNNEYGYFKVANGSEIWLGGLNDAQAMERILGNEYATIYENEASEIRYDAHLLLRTRLAQVCTTLDGTPLTQRMYVDLNPTTRMHWTYRLWIDGVEPQDEKAVDRSLYAYSVINPYDNRANLSGDMLADLEALPDRQRRRFLLGEYTSDDDNALWRRSFFKRVQVKADGDWPVKMRRIVIAVDPATTSNPGSDETGIVAVGVGVDGFGYVLADESGKYRPEEWARRAVSLFKSLDADRIVAEVNNGGDMVEATVRAVAPDVPYKAVNATRGKVQRAEPVAALYERGKVLHVGVFPELEDQCCAVTVGFNPRISGWSPDRVDALVWGITELFPTLSARAQSSGAVPLPQFSRV
jgi:hypothetical protein